jgi:hypothetical protein
MLKLLLIGVLAAPAALAPPSAAAAARQNLDVRAKVRLIPGHGATLAQRGTFAGAPLGRGRISLQTRVGQGDGAVFNFVMTTRRGTLRGSGTVRLDFDGPHVNYDGRADITSGTGVHSGRRARGLRVTGSGTVTGDAFRVRLTGAITP